MVKLSLIISTYNRPDTLDLVLKSVALQNLAQVAVNDEIEVLIADDGSSAETGNLVAEFRRNFPFKLIHVWHEDNGFRLAAIRNFAVSHSSGQYLVFIDGDCLIAPDFIANQLQLAKIGYFVGGNRVLLSEKYTRKILANKDISISSAGVFSSFIAKLSGKINKFFPRLPLAVDAAWRLRNDDNWRRPKGCNMALWRKDLLTVNGFDESFCGWGHEDADFLVRLLHAGIHIKDGRFAVPVFHLWHKMNDRSKEFENIARLQQRINNPQLIRAESGVKRYLAEQSDLR